MRTDIHRPSVIIPADYQYVGVEHMKIEGFGDCKEVLGQRLVIKNHMVKTGGTYSNHEHGGNCHICGAHCIYTILFYHEKSNSYIRTGNDCADKLDMAFDNAAFNRLVDGVKNARAAVAGKAKAQAILSDLGLGELWATYGPDASATDEWKFEELTINDIINKLVKYGELSDAQVNFVRKLVGQIANRAAVEAARKAESDAAAPCPTGRVIIEGVVLGIKDVDSAYGPQTKILVRDNSGFKVWGSRFSASYADGGVQKGQQVKFVATVEPSKDDPKFGFFKRPIVYRDPAIAKIQRSFSKKELASIAY